MTDLLQPETFEFFARYLLAGYIMLSVRSRLVAGQRPKPSEILLDVIVLSLINQAVFLGVLAITDASAGTSLVDKARTASPASVLFFAEIILLPAALGVLFGRFSGVGIVGSLLRRLSMPGTSPIARAYDHAFLQNTEPCFVILTFQDDTVVYGWFGGQSLAATDTNRSDIFVESLYTYSNGQWVETDPPRSALISLEGLRSIEFLKHGESQNGKQSVC